MDLVVAGADLPLAVDDEAAVGYLAVADQNRERANIEPDMVAPCGFAAGGEDDVVLFAAQAVGGPSAVPVEQPRHLGREEHFRAARRRFGNNCAQGARVRLRIDAGVRLEQSDFRHVAADSNGSSLPAWSSAIRSSQPPLCCSPTKIWGTRVRPL